MATRKSKTEQAAELTPEVPDVRTEGAPAAEAPKSDETIDESTFTREFVVSLKGVKLEDVELEDVRADEAFHNANKVATLQDAINGGFRATGYVSVASIKVEGEGRRANLRARYSVPVVKATEDERHPSEVPSPREMIADMGGTTTGDTGDQPA
jgi:hypothetical protein